MLSCCHYLQTKLQGTCISEHFKEDDFASTWKCKFKRLAVPKLFESSNQKTYSTKLTAHH